MRDVQAAVDGALEGAKDAVAGGGADEADVQHASEGARLALLLHEEHLTVRLSLSLVRLVDAHLLEQAARAEQACPVGRGG